MIDEAQRAAKREGTPYEVLSALAAIPAELLPSITIGLDPSCGLVVSSLPVLQIWRVNQPDFAGDERVDLGEGADRLLVRRDADTVGIERIDPSTFAFLQALASGQTLALALEAAQAADAAFDLAAVLSRHVGVGTLARFDLPVR